MSAVQMYQVMRPFGPHSVGEKLRGDEFDPSRRAAQLVDQRYLTPVFSGVGYQPSSNVLLESTIRALRPMMEQMVDSCVLQKALEQETREIAVQMFSKRIEELELEANDAESTD